MEILIYYNLKGKFLKTRKGEKLIKNFILKLSVVLNTFIFTK